MFPPSLRKFKSCMWFVVLTLFVCACVPQSTAMPVQPPLSVPDADAAAAHVLGQSYLDFWQSGDYADMYDLLTTLTKDAIPLDAFTAQHQAFEADVMLEKVDFQILSAFAEGTYAQVAYRLTYDTVLFDPFSTDTLMNLSLEQTGWRIQWEVGMILPDLRGGNSLTVVYDIPARGQIYAAGGTPLAGYGTAVDLGVVPGEVLPEQSALLYETLSELSHYTPDQLAEMIAATPADWYLPIISLSKETIQPYLEILTGLSGVRVDEFRARYYVDGGVASHALGYLLLISEENLPAYLAQGYRQDEQVGASGLEAAYETELAGKRGGSLYLVDPQGEVIGLLASKAPVPAASLFTTLDKNLQMRIQDSLGDLRAAVVVMEVETGRILALVSNPDFDPNVFNQITLDQDLIAQYFADVDQPLFNRAAQGQYPLGSVFKIISMATALETGIYNADSSFICGYSLNVCDSVTLYDWTYEHGTAASGELTLPEGLMRSCNPWFYRIGERLYVEGLTEALLDMAFGFGLGRPVDVEINESSGNIPETASTCVNSAQMAIGQGEILVTPLQVAKFITAVANGGKLFRPALVEKIVPSSASPSYSFSPEFLGELPVSDQTLLEVQNAMQAVVESPRGTAYWALQDLAIPVSGKTGTAQTPTGSPHAWFAGYTRLNDPERPDIAVVVLVENGGEGSVVAAPIFARVVSLYTSNNENPGALLPWESAPYLVPTASPTLTSTPTAPSGE